MAVIAQWNDFTTAEDTADSIYDRSGNDNTGILHDDADFSLIGARGRVLNFAGSSADIRVPDTALLSPTASVSVGAWIFKTDSNQAMIVDKDQAYRLWIPSNDNIPYFSVYCSGAWYSLAASSLVIPTNQWVFLQGGYDSATDTAQLYCQGVLNNEDTNFVHGAVNDSTSIMYIGRFGGGGYQFKGYMGEIILHDALIDLTTHRTNLKRWLKRRSGRVVEFLELHIGGGVEPIYITTQPESVTATVYDILGLTSSSSSSASTSVSTSASTSSSTSTSTSTSV